MKLNKVGGRRLLDAHITNDGRRITDKAKREKLVKLLKAVSWHLWIGFHRDCKEWWKNHGDDEFLHNANYVYDCIDCNLENMIDYVKCFGYNPVSDYEENKLKYEAEISDFLDFEESYRSRGKIIYVDKNGKEIGRG